MSAILQKPFSWANKIYRAVFKGAPNLITTSDLNRQLEALKQEIFARQQLSGVFSDLKIVASTMVNPNNTMSVRLVATGTYVYANGTRFSISLDDTVYIANIVGASVLNLYAKKTIVTANDDFSKTISGAKFEDGTVYPAADHYVYGEAMVKLVEKSAPNEEFVYPEQDGFEYVCSLAVCELYSNESLILSRNPSNFSLQMLCTSLGNNAYDIDVPYGVMKVPTVYAEENLFKVQPVSSETLRKTVTKLYDRLYSVERLLFAETSSGYRLTNHNDYSLNGQYPSLTRRKSYYIDPNSEVEICYITIGPICYLWGNIKYYFGTSGIVTKQVTLDSSDTFLPAPLVPGDAGMSNPTGEPRYAISTVLQETMRISSPATYHASLVHYYVDGDNKRVLSFELQPPPAIGSYYYCFNMCFPFKNFRWRFAENDNTFLPDDRPVI